MILAQTVLEIYNSEVVGGVIFGRFTNVDNFRPKTRSDVMSGVLIDPTGLKVHVKFDDSRSNRSRNKRLPHFVTNDDDDDGRRAPRAMGQLPKNIISTAIQSLLHQTASGQSVTCIPVADKKFKQRVHRRITIVILQRTQP